MREPLALWCCVLLQYVALSAALLRLVRVLVAYHSCSVFVAIGHSHLVCGLPTGVQPAAERVSDSARLSNELPQADLVGD